jgi:hypothetical protein
MLKHTMPRNVALDLTVVLRGFFKKVGESQQVGCQISKAIRRIVYQFLQTRRAQVEGTHITYKVAEPTIFIKTLSSLGFNHCRAQTVHFDRHLTQQAGMPLGARRQTTVNSAGYIFKNLFYSGVKPMQVERHPIPIIIITTSMSFFCHMMARLIVILTSSREARIRPANACRSLIIPDLLARSLTAKSDGHLQRQSNPR